MFDAQLYDVFVEAIRCLFLFGLPVLLAVAVAGTLAGALQTATSIHEPSVGYAVRLCAVLIVLYAMFSETASALLNLGRLVYQ